MFLTKPLWTSTPPRVAPVDHQRSAGTGNSWSSPGHGSPGRRAGTKQGGLQFPQCSRAAAAGKERDLRCLRPRCLRPGSARGAEMELVELGGESPRVAAPTRSPQATAGPCMPRPEISGALLQLGGRADGRSDGPSGVGRAKSRFSRKDQGSGGLWVWRGCPWRR